MNKSEIEEMILQCEQNAIPDSEIDYSDIPPVRDFSGFEFKNKEYFKPRREQVSIRLSSYLVEHFKNMGKGWQTKVNDFLMDAVEKNLI